MIKGPYQPTWESLDSHPLPQWFDDGKFGMFIDWGLWSVPGWGPLPEKGATYPDWYLFRMYNQYRDYHVKTYGEDFERDDFIPMFTGEEYNPQELIKIAQQSGMKYVVPFCKHHDGFCLWPSSVTGRDAMDMSPKRDLIGPLVKACRAAGMKFGFYQSVEEWEYPVLDENGHLQVRIWDGAKAPYLAPYDEKRLRRKITGKIPVRNYAKEYLAPQTLEFIEKYDPDLLWYDGDWTTPADELDTREVVADYYNRAEGRKEVCVNDRMGMTRLKHGDFYTSEYGEVYGHGEFDITSGARKKWEECRGISQSFGYNWQDTEKNIISAGEFVRMLVKIVAHNGNLLLIVNLDGKGALPEIQRTRLMEVGRWLRVNGEAIYGTRPWKRPAQGDIHFTRSMDGRYVYIISHQRPSGSLRIESLRAADGSKVQLLGGPAALDWKQNGDNLEIGAAAQPNSAEHAWVFKVEMQR